MKNNNVFYLLLVISIIFVMTHFVFAIQSASKDIEPLKLETSQEDLSVVVENNNKFAFELFAVLSGKSDGNLFFSPNSISTALAMTYAGAQGETGKQMRQVLNFPFEDIKLHECFKALLLQMNSGESEDIGYQLNIANRLWGQEDFPFSESYLQLTKDFYDAELAKVDFRGDAEGVRKIINIWIAEKTAQKIQNLLGPGVVTPATALILTNAIYFKGDWASKFKTEQTKQSPFYISEDEKTEVPMMRQSAEFKYMENDEIQMIEMPYKNDELAMIIVLPKERYGLSEVEKSISADRIGEWSKVLLKKKVEVFFPKFRLESEFKLKETFMAMGMIDAFTGKADFSGMIDETKRDLVQGKLFISDVVHKAYVDVNEEGTEAAAATGVVMAVTTSMVTQPPPVFRADHPFIFLICDKRSNSILFLGRVNNPS